MAPKKKVAKKVGRKKTLITFAEVREALLQDITKQVMACNDMGELDEFSFYALGKTINMLVRFDNQEDKA